ncbi:hypothetical protein [Streptomyces mirabilis]|uniref:hypothetical protein n=1 Tax=Streptomyces mirabilis TaxID=68239 RepID=UPI002E1C2E83
MARQHAPGSGASAGTGGFAVSGDVTMKATNGSVVAGVVNGGVRVDPPQPGPVQD